MVGGAGEGEAGQELTWGCDGPIGREPRGGRPSAREPAVSVRGAPDAGAVPVRAHSPGLLRHRVPGPGPVRRVALPAHRRPAVPDAGPAVVENHAGAVRGGRGYRDHLVLRARAAVAGVD